MRKLLPAGSLLMLEILSSACGAAGSDSTKRVANVLDVATLNTAQRQAAWIAKLR